MHTDTREENLLRSIAHEDNEGDGRTTRRWDYSGLQTPEGSDAWIGGGL